MYALSGCTAVPGPPMGCASFTQSTNFTDAVRPIRFNVSLLLSLSSTPPGMPGTHLPNILVGGDVNGNIPPPILLRRPTIGYSRPLLVALRSLSLKPISFGYKTPPVRFSQAGGQSADKARPPNLELALTSPLVTFVHGWIRLISRRLFS